MVNNRKNKKQTTSSVDQANEKITKHVPKVVLRTYQESDHDQVEYLFRSTTIPLVYESIRSKIWAPLTWLVGFVFYTILLLTIPRAVTAIAGPLADWVDTLLRVVITFTWGLIGFAVLFIASDRVELQNRVDEALANDLKDPEVYYLNHKYSEDGKKVLKSKKDQVPSHFWVLTLDEEVCGMIALSCNAEDVYDQRKEIPVAWKQFTVAVLELLRLPVPAFLEKGKPTPDKFLFANKQIPKTATITRLALRGEVQTCGFSTLLINRAISWAK